MTAVFADLSVYEDLIVADAKNVNVDHWRELGSAIESRLIVFRESKDEEQANKAWYLLRLVNARLAYLSCFKDLKAQNFYEAWCELERIEIDLNSLLRNSFYSPVFFGIGEFRDLIERWQALFPYTVFFSPGFLHKRVECGICNTQVSPWNDCGHEKGKVYMGVECIHHVKEVEITEISLVKDPVQKYSVALFTTDGDGNKSEIHNYAVLRFLVNRIAQPYDGWRCSQTMALHPHSLFPDATPDSACPCESGASYQHCCLGQSGVKRPHVQFEFQFAPPEELPAVEFSGYGEANTSPP